jgi:hypothetical protein
MNLGRDYTTDYKCPCHDAIAEMLLHLLNHKE